MKAIKNICPVCGNYTTGKVCILCKLTFLAMVFEPGELPENDDFDIDALVSDEDVILYFTRHGLVA